MINDSEWPRIEAQLELVTEDSRNDYLFNTPISARATRMSPRQFGNWYRRNFDDKLTELAIYQPLEFATEIMRIMARANIERQRRLKQQEGLRYE